MTYINLVNKERDFFDLNKELEEKVKSLVCDLDLIINKQENVMRSPKKYCNAISTRSKVTKSDSQSRIKPFDEFYSDSESLSFEKSIKNNISIQITNEHEGDQNVSEEKESLIKSRKRSANNTIIRFLKAQITKLQTEMQAAQYKIKKQDDYCKQLETEIKNNEEKRGKLYNQLSSQKEIIIKADVLNSELQLKIQAQNAEINTLKKEIDCLKKDLKSLNQFSSNSDLRLNRSLEENEKLRMSLKTSEAEEKELREQVRKIQEEKRLVSKNSEKQRCEIFQAFKKQMQLMDNLKRQKAYLEVDKEIQFVEEDFTKLLEWTPDKIL